MNLRGLTRMLLIDRTIGHVFSWLQPAVYDVFTGTTDACRVESYARIGRLYPREAVFTEPQHNLRAGGNR